MAKLTKKQKQMADIDRNKLYSLGEALEIVKKFANAKFDESIDIAINLGVDPRKSDQMIRGALVLPNGTGKTCKVAVFAEADAALNAKNAGADIVGLEDLVESVKKGNLDFDIVIATPSAMRLVGTLGQILGPRGLMPNPKVGTVTNDVALAVKNAKAGQVQYRTDKNGIIHAIVGKKSFDDDKLLANIAAITDVIIKAKPSSSKGQYLKGVAISSTMGIGLKVDTTTIR